MYAKEDAIDEQIESLENQLKEEQRKIDQLKNNGRTLQEQLVEHQTLRQKLDELNSSNESRQKQLEERENALAQKEAEIKAAAEKKQQEMLARNKNHVQENVKDMEDIYNDSGLGTTANALPGITPEKEQPPTEAAMNKTLENLTRGGTPTGEELNVTLENLTRGPRPELLSSTPAVMLGLRGLVDTSKVTRRILSSTQLPQESPIPRSMMGNPFPYQTPMRATENEKQPAAMR